MCQYVYIFIYIYTYIDTYLHKRESLECRRATDNKPATLLYLKRKTFVAASGAFPPIPCCVIGIVLAAPPRCPPRAVDP